MPPFRHRKSIPPSDNATESNSVTPIQFSPSRLPELLAGLGEEECASITARILPQLQKLLCCPICHDVLLDDPVVVETCGHAFCYDCINTVIEEGCYEALPEEENSKKDRAKDIEANGSDQEGNKSECDGKSNERKRPRALGGTQRREKPRRRKLQFSCPVCFGPAFKWTLVRIPFVRDVVMEAMSHPVLANAIRHDPDSDGLDEAEAQSCLLPSAENAADTSPPNASDGEASSMTVDVSHTLDTSATKGLGVPVAINSGALPMTSCSYTMDSQQQSMVIIPFPCFSLQAVENSTVASSEHGEDSIISGVNGVAVSHPMSATLHHNNSNSHSREDSSSSSTVISADLQGGMIFEDMNREDDEKLDDAINSSVSIHASEQPPPVEEEISESKPLQEVKDLVLGEVTEEGCRDVAQALQSPLKSLEEQEKIHEEKSLAQAPPKDDFSVIETSTVNSWRANASPISLENSLRLLLDASMPQETYVDGVLLSATRLFGAVINVNERICDEKRRSEYVQTPPLRTITRSFHSMNSKRSGASITGSSLHWMELHYASVPMMCTHCIAGFSLDRDGSIIFAITPAIGSALVTKSAVVAWTWLADSVAAERLLPTAPYMERDAWCAQHALSDTRPGQWMTQGYGFLVLPDDQLYQLLFGHTYAVEPMGRKTGGFDNESWRRLVLLSGGVWLRLSDECLGALVEQAMCVQGARDRWTLREAASKGTDTSEEALWRAECCPDRAGDLPLHRIVVLRATVSMVKRSEVSEYRMSRFVKYLYELFGLAETDAQEPTHSLYRVQFGGKREHGDSSPLSPFAPTQFTFPAGENEENSANIKVEMRSCQWLLKNIRENRRTAGVRRQHHSYDNLGSGTAFSGGAVFQQLLYDV